MCLQVEERAGKREAKNEHSTHQTKFIIETMRKKGFEAQISIELKRKRRVSHQHANHMQNNKRNNYNKYTKQAFGPDVLEKYVCFSFIVRNNYAIVIKFSVKPSQ